MLDLPKVGRLAIEIKRGLTPRVEKGFYIACEDIEPVRRFVVHSGSDRYPMGADIEAIGVRELASELASGKSELRATS